MAPLAVFWLTIAAIEAYGQGSQSDGEWDTDDVLRRLALCMLWPVWWTYCWGRERAAKRRARAAQSE